MKEENLVSQSERVAIDSSRWDQIRMDGYNLELMKQGESG